MLDDPYTVLGVAPDATQDEIRRAYRARMRTTHPDLRPGDPAAATAAAGVNAAYAVIGDRTRRAAHDRVRAPVSGGQPGAVRVIRAPAHTPAYSAAKQDYGREVHSASLRFVTALVLLGFALLLLVGRI